MARPMVVTQQKLSEKLTVLHHRGQGMLTRIYNIKKACSDQKSKPAFLSDKSLESSVKYIQRRFPNIDPKSLSSIQPLRNEILKSLSLYYYTFVDLLDYRDHVSELLTTLDACQITLDITNNYDVTRLYLHVVTIYVRLLILLSRVEDRKAVLGLFNAAHEMIHSQCDPSFPRLGQMIVEYESPLKKLSEEFVPHTKTLTTALLSLGNIYPRRNLSAEQWRSAQMLSLVSNPGQLLNPAHTDTIPCEYLSLETMERWIVFGFAVCHPSLSHQTASDLWTLALSCNWVVALFRDEVVYIHSYIQSFFESIKGYGKKVSEIKDCYNAALATAPAMHAERRNFLRSALRELGLLCSDQPGILGPKALFIFMGMCFARDEVIWLIQHHENPPIRQSKVKVGDDLVDRYLPELIFYMEEIRALVRKYSQVIQRYYVQYLAGYDAVALNQSMQVIFKHVSILKFKLKFSMLIVFPLTPASKKLLHAARRCCH
jgi:NCK-associated protein 1